MRLGWGLVFASIFGAQSHSKSEIFDTTVILLQSLADFLTSEARGSTGKSNNLPRKNKLTINIELNNE